PLPHRDVLQDGDVPIPVARSPQARHEPPGITVRERRHVNKRRRVNPAVDPTVRGARRIGIHPCHVRPLRPAKIGESIHPRVNGTPHPRSTRRVSLAPPPPCQVLRPTAGVQVSLPFSDRQFPLIVEHHDVRLVPPRNRLVQPPVLITRVTGGLFAVCRHRR